MITQIDEGQELPVGWLMPILNRKICDGVHYIDDLRNPEDMEFVKNEVIKISRNLER